MIQTAESLHQTFGQMVGGYWTSQAIYVAAEYGIADLLADGPENVDWLAQQAGVQSGPLYRVLRALASVGIFKEEEGRTFMLTPLAERMRSDVEHSQRSFARMMGAELYQAWGNLADTVRTGKDGFAMTYGKPFFEYITGKPERHAIFDEHMNGTNGLQCEPMLNAYDFGYLDLIADIGGGNGQTLSAILRRHSHVQGILFDMPPVVERAKAALEQSDIADRCQIRGGDFFSAVPAGCDAYLMRHIIHDWDDEHSRTILRNCRDAMKPDGRVLLAEFVISGPDEPSAGKWLDLMMLLIGGKERTEEEYQTLFSSAGLRLNDIYPTSSGISVIEAVRA